MKNIDRLDKDELRWALEGQNDLVQEALKELNKAKDGDWNHKECGCSYCCGDGHDDNKLEICYTAIKEAIRLLGDK